MPVVPPNPGQDLGSVVDAANRVRQAFSGAEWRRRRTDRSRHQRECRVESQQGDAQKARANGALHDRSLGEAAAAIGSRRQDNRT
jgi:hypothetical protein